ncbi:flagellar basal-body rod protein FlgF [Candidatus Formimonas warabiya]|uniref:Flagellar basal-body rod protein FlgF n=1 Tax=Formimonas warabiya TaxID=1761012 RepID=A0A3G1KTA9_FORW1|nr:flagellar basal-body rod protein FlgF [Candidatus Formimonas warabiya]ATW25660.1 flagellar basal-body rod protein FlgF [Candidatus Formimonas warabiya]
MIRSLYSGVSGMKNNQTALDVIANNIANVNTPGFKSQKVAFEDLMSQTISNATTSSDTSLGANASQVGVGSTVSGIASNFSQGISQTTERDLDLAINGNGFFVVQDINGRVYYTRDGAFEFDSDGYLVNRNGYRVLSNDGSTIQITDTISSVTVDSSGLLTALDEEGNAVSGSGVNLGVAYILNPESLIREGGNLYSKSASTRVDPDASDTDFGIDIAGNGGRGTVLSHRLEASNVDLTTEFSDMIVTQRAYQANARVITTSDTMLEELINLKR